MNVNVESLSRVRRAFFPSGDTLKHDKQDKTKTYGIFPPGFHISWHNKQLYFQSRAIIGTVGECPWFKKRLKLAEPSCCLVIKDAGGSLSVLQYL